MPAVLTGFALAFARAVGEYGSVIFIAGNMPYVSEIAPVLIIIKLEEYNYAGATVIAAIMLAISFVTLLAINLHPGLGRDGSSVMAEQAAPATGAPRRWRPVTSEAPLDARRPHGCRACLPGTVSGPAPRGCLR